MRKVDKVILRIAVPAIVTNITVPLLGLVDLSIAGHLGDISYIGAISVGAMLFNLIYWNFSFLRMGTTGMTAQYYGAENREMVSQTLYRALFVALVSSVLLIVLQDVIWMIGMKILSPSCAVGRMAEDYFRICIWGAPALLTTLAVKGWFLGMQNSRYPMIVSVSINVLNILASVISVFLLEIGFKGIAIGTVVAEYIGLMIAVMLLVRKYSQQLAQMRPKSIVTGNDVKRFFTVNRDIFFRSLFLLSVTFSFTAIGARAGDIVLAVNSILMQLFLFYSYFMDGFAYAAEAIVGKYQGSGAYRQRDNAVARIFCWGAGVAFIYSVIYGMGLQYIVPLMTDRTELYVIISDNGLWCVLFPIIGLFAFIFDGVFVGLTATKKMMLSTMLSAMLFFGVYFAGGQGFSNTRLWISFLLFLALRGIVLAVSYLKIYRHDTQ